MGIIRNTYHRLLLVPGLPSCFRSAMKNCATVFMLHRFEDKDRGIVGLNPAILRHALGFLRQNGYEFLSLRDMYERLAGNGPELNGAVVFTIDDGYIDHAEIAGPVFAEFDCPVTTFVTTGFLDGNLWMWWDKIEYIFTKTRCQSASIQINGETLDYKWHHVEELGLAKKAFIERCKILSDNDKHRAISLFADRTEVDLPVKPPIMYEPMTWNHVRNYEKSGMSFGPHTVTHPVMSRISTEQASFEINESWHRLCEEATNPVPVFCYPNGQWSDFGTREIELLQDAGLVGAVVGERGFADVSSFRLIDTERFMMRRLPFPDDLSDLIQFVSGIERCKLLLRGMS